MIRVCASICGPRTDGELGYFFDGQNYWAFVQGSPCTPEQSRRFSYKVRFVLLSNRAFVQGSPCTPFQSRCFFVQGSPCTPDNVTLNVS
jgi:hypothetical protein